MSDSNQSKPTQLHSDSLQLARAAQIRLDTEIAANQQQLEDQTDPHEQEVLLRARKRLAEELSFNRQQFRQLLEPLALNIVHMLDVIADHKQSAAFKLTRDGYFDGVVDREFSGVFEERLTRAGITFVQKPSEGQGTQAYSIDGTQETFCEKLIGAAANTQLNGTYTGQEKARELEVNLRKTLPQATVISR